MQDHCPKCKGVSQRLRLNKIDFDTVNCNENVELVEKLGLRETPVIIDTDGKRYIGPNSANEYLNK